MREKHNIETAKEKFAKKQNITVCMIINSGVIYKGGFYPDCYLEDYEGMATFCIEVDDFLNIFMPNGEFACAYRMDKIIARKDYLKILNRTLK